MAQKNPLKWLDLTTRKSLVSAPSELTLSRRCELMEIPHTGMYNKPIERNIERENAIKDRLDYWHTKMPYLGVRKLRNQLQNEDGIKIGRKLIKWCMDEMGIYAVYPKPNLSGRKGQHKVYPYLLRKMEIFLPNQVWEVDIIYIKISHRHMYLTAIIDWCSRFIVGWELSATLETAPVLTAVRKAITIYGKPGIINSDQGCQYTSEEYTGLLKQQGIRQSMDGKARWVDNAVIERWFRSLKTENISINEYTTPRALRAGIGAYITEYDHDRPHKTFGDTPPRPPSADKLSPMLQICKATPHLWLLTFCIFVCLLALMAYLSGSK